jgi:hypothetical protein
MNWKSFSYWVPGPIAFFVAKWVGLFSQTTLAHPRWEVNANNDALAIGAVTTAILSFLLRGSSKRRLKVFAVIGFVAVIVGIAACLYFWFWLGAAMPERDVRQLQDYWRITYTATLVVLVATISIGAVSATGRADSNKKWMWVSVVLGSALLLLVVFIILKR